MSSHRVMEVLFGIVTLVSVVSVPVPRRVQKETVLANRPRIDTARVEELQRVSDVQRDDIARLTRETRELSRMMLSRRLDGGTVGTPGTRVPQPEIEEHECNR